MSQMPDNPESLHPILRESQQELAQQLDEVCDNRDVVNEDTNELIKLEESLSFAAEKAKETISLRRRIKDKGDVRGTSGLTERGDHPEGTQRGG